MRETQCLADHGALILVFASHELPAPSIGESRFFCSILKNKEGVRLPSPPLLYTVTGAHLHHHQLYPWQLCQLSHKLIDWKAWHENVHALPF